ncbi:MAG: SWIM zinc finger family protein [Betaproteobacteria bacterium]
MFYQWKPYVSAAERRKKAERAAARFARKGGALDPVRIAGRTIAATFWGKAWCGNMERYSDFANRLPRGRTYVRNGSVIDLRIAAGEVKAQVVGSAVYKTTVKIAAVQKARWQALGRDCAGSIDSLVELLQGRLSGSVMERICRPETGLFPSPKEIAFQCSCPDWASMCKHVAAVLYGIGARLDRTPELLFTLRGVEANALVARAGQDLPLARKAPAAGKVLERSRIADVFGIEMAESAAPAPRGKAGAAKRSSAPAKKAGGRRQPR